MVDSSKNKPSASKVELKIDSIWLELTTSIATSRLSRRRRPYQRRRRCRRTALRRLSRVRDVRIASPSFLLLLESVNVTHDGTLRSKALANGLDLQRAIRASRLTEGRWLSIFGLKQNRAIRKEQVFRWLNRIWMVFSLPKLLIKARVKVLTPVNFPSDLRSSFTVFKFIEQIK